MLGSHQVVELKIDPELLEDIDMLQDAVLLRLMMRVAVVDKKTEEEMSRFTWGWALMKVPNSLSKLIENLKSLPGIGEKQR